MTPPKCFHLYLSLLAATATVLIAVADAQAGGQVLQAELWCVAKNNAEDSSLQTAIDWACGQGGADCSPIQQGRACNDPTDIQKMASYVFNNYYLKNGLADDACNFNNNAALTSINPSKVSIFFYIYSKLLPFFELVEFVFYLCQCVCVCFQVKELADTLRGMPF